jgi:adenosylmethionine-8-amino-7-oxononanoate aminotransferase
MGTEIEKIRIIDKDELVEKGKEIYKKIKDRLEPAHKGEIVAIDVKTGDYFLGKDVVEADEKAREKYPDDVFYFNKIGYRAVYVHR